MLSVMEKGKMILAGDIGGTKTGIGVFSVELEVARPVFEHTYPSQGFVSLNAILAEFLAEHQVDVDCAVFAVAGPVVGRRAEVTNLPWQIEGDQIGVDFGWSQVALLNDLESVALAVPHLQADELAVLQCGERDATGTKAVVAPGTGLGESYSTWDGTGYRAYASEGGHTDFAARTEQEFALLQHVQKRLGIEHVSYERLCSGSGLPNIYAFLADTGDFEIKTVLFDAIQAAEDPTPLIVAAALDKTAPSALCEQTLRMFVSLLGAEAGNMALNLMAWGGVYLAGGIPPRILPFLKAGEFLNSFNQKGRFEATLKRMPVYVVLNSQAGLLGAARYGLQLES